MELRELVLLDNEFFSLLDLGERIVVEDVAKDIGLSDFGKHLLDKAQGKWIRTFFKEDLSYKKLDPVALGFIIQTIRKTHGYSKTKLAKETGFNRKYILKVEKGEILPSLEFVYRIIKVLEIPFNRLVDYFNYL